ncbi:hypothetical protein FIU87_03290 [Bacillus sp. THAF10]|uniref:hypothetical protein n=1 Tax=Bacillus sp. THAF10 TaxID=2587848 RepID=UPI001268530A|nr:hypothetical protein [Bacillus sp. THAF10]QFT87666.1 hypothetical protein FIU87_03290 [Bacillus sp. THAF10]
MLYESFEVAIYALLFWWGILLAFKRFPSNYTHNNTWKKDISVTFIQSVVLLATFQIIVYFQ